MKFRPILLAWLLLLGATLAMGAGAWWLLDREADRIEAVRAGVLANSSASVAESVNLLMEEIRDGVTEGLLQARVSSQPKVSLAELTENNPYVRAGFYFRTSDGVTTWFGDRGDIPSPLEWQTPEGESYPWTYIAAGESEVDEAASEELSKLLDEEQAQNSVTQNILAPTDIFENVVQAPNVIAKGKDQNYNYNSKYQQGESQDAIQFNQDKSEALKEQRANVRKVITYSNSVNSINLQADERVAVELEIDADGAEYVDLQSLPAPVQERAARYIELPSAQSVAGTQSLGASSLSVRSNEDLPQAAPDMLAEIEVADQGGLVLQRFDAGSLAQGAPSQPQHAELGRDYIELTPKLPRVISRRQIKPVNPVRHGWAERKIGDDEQWMTWANLPDGDNIMGAWLNREAVIAELAKTIQISQLPDLQFMLVDAQGRRIAGARGTYETLRSATPSPMTLQIGAALPGWRIEAYPVLWDNPLGHSFRLLGGLVVMGLCIAILLGGSLLLWQAQRDARDAQRKTTFVANVSHELKTPLTSIRLFAEMLYDGRAGDETKQRRYLQTMLNETQRLTRLVNNVLDFSRLERGRRDFQTESIDLAAAVGEIIEAQRERLAGDGLTLEYHDGGRSLEVSVDRDAIEQILLNLLDNAAKYALCGKRAEVRLEANTDCWKLSVCDFGPGIPARERQQVFEAFHRIDARLTAERPGCGLGLSIAARLARGMGGQLHLMANQPQGCCFHLKVPFKHTFAHG